MTAVELMEEIMVNLVKVEQLIMATMEEEEEEMEMMITVIVLMVVEVVE